MYRRFFVGLVLIGALGACGGNGSPVAVPNVVGMKLDEAKESLSAAGFKDVESKDAVEDRVIILESNWIVVQQTPSAGTQADTGTVVVLGVRKESDAGSTPPGTSTPPTSDAAQAVSSYLRANFATTSWYPFITNIKIVASAVWVETSLFPDADAQDPASGICRGVSSYVFSTENTFNLTGLTVRASDGQRLVLRSSISDSC